MTTLNFGTLKIAWEDEKYERVPFHCLQHFGKMKLSVLGTKRYLSIENQAMPAGYSGTCDFSASLGQYDTQSRKRSEKNNCILILSSPPLLAQET